MRKCYFCGSDVPNNAKFCPKCGKTVEISQNLIDQAKGNDPDAQTELYERSYRLVYSRIRAKVPDDDTAVDIMQETYLRAFTSLDQLQNAETFPSWLLTIANRQTCDWYRKNEKENENVQMSQMEYVNDDTISNEDDLLEEYEYREDFSPEESLDREETGRLLSEILDTLPEDQRIILIMRYYDEMSLKEISDELGVNLSTVKSRLTAGKKKVETKVLELERTGTKLYSLGPIAFLVFLLHHAEIFAPNIPANTVIGLTAAGAAGAGGAISTHVTAGAVAKTAAAAVAKGVSVKVVAIIAAAVVVVGGGVTATIVAINNSNTNQETADSSVTLESAETPGPLPVPPPEPPSDETVHNMAVTLSDWAASVVFDFDAPDSSPGKIYLNTNRAVELAGLATYYDGNDESMDFSADQVNTYLKKLFGSQYQLSDFTNTAGESEGEEYVSAFSAEYPGYRNLEWIHRTENGLFHVDFLPTDNVPSVTEVAVKSIDRNDDSTYSATVTYKIKSHNPDSHNNDVVTSWSLDITYDLIPDVEAEYGWAITSFSLSDEYDKQEETIIPPPSEDTIHAIVDPLAFWSLNLWGDTMINVGPFVPTVDQAAELAAGAYLWDNGGLSAFEFDYSTFLGYLLPEDGIAKALNNLFGPEYQLSDFTNPAKGPYTYESAFSTFGIDTEHENVFHIYLLKENGQFYYNIDLTDGMYYPEDIVIESIKESNSKDNVYNIEVAYMYEYSEYLGSNADNSPVYNGSTAARNVSYELAPSEASDYGWIITQIKYN